MNSVPQYHLSITGRAVIDAESARIRQGLAVRRAERESRLHQSAVFDGMVPPTLPVMAAASAADPSAEVAAVRP